MYKIPANTLFIGKKLVYVPQCHSTNTLAAEFSQKGETVEGTIVITDNQFAGRGQRGNTWEATPGENLTLSILLKPHFLQAKEQFQINIAVSLGVADYFQQRTAALNFIHIKWPNDILAADKKIGGILIENHLQGTNIQCSIVGIGLNINQENFQHPKAISLSVITEKEYNLNEELAILAECVEARYLELKHGNIQGQKADYLKSLYRRNETHRFRSDGIEWNGKIMDVDEVGRLKIITEGAERVFGVKEVAFL